MDGENDQHEPIISRSAKVHTTVGTADSYANRTLYINNATEQALTNYLVMCYYIDGSGNLCYQTAQDLKLDDDSVVNNEVVDINGDDGTYYRVMIPEDAMSVRLGFLSCDVEGKYYYGAPYLSGGVITGFNGPTYYGYSEQVEITDATRTITFNSIRDIGLQEFYYDPNP